MKYATLMICLIACGPGKEGPAGPAGDAGPTGSQGQRGATGGGAVSSFSSCAKTVANILYAYDAVGFSDGSRFVSCSIAGAAFTVSQSDLWASGQGAAAAGTCSVTFDLDTASGGYWVFELVPKQAKYHDAGSASDGMAVVFSATDCSNG